MNGVPACMHVVMCVCLCLSVHDRVCVTAQGKWGSVLGSVCVCGAGTVSVRVPVAA